MKNPKLENWSLTLSLPSIYAAPEQGSICLQGDVRDHEYLDPGHVKTSSVVSIDLDTKLAKTKNTWYELGEMDPKYATWLKEHNKTIEDIVNNT